MKNMKKLSATLVSLAVFSVLGTSSAQAVTLDNPFSGGNSLFSLLRAIIDGIVLPIGGVLAVLLYVTAQGNETKLKTAHKALLYTSIGTAVLLGSWVIAKVIENTINQLRP